MTTAKTYARLFALASVAILGWTAEAKTKTKEPPTTDIGKLRAAVIACDLTQLKSLIDAGMDLNAVDASGNNALSYASEDIYPAAQTRFGVKKEFRLKCPAAVTALTQAGANPSKAKVYHSPKLDDTPPSLTALLSVQDGRETKGGGLDVTAKLTKSIETNLHLFHYPLIKLEEVRQKLRTAGFSEDDTLHPDPIKACKILGTDAVVDATLKDFRKKDIGVVVANGSSIEIDITDCGTGDLLFRSDLGLLNESRGYIARAFINEFDLTVGAALQIPIYQKGEK